MPREKKNIKYLNVENRGITALDSVKFDYDVENDCYYKDIREFINVKKQENRVNMLTLQYTYIERIGIKYCFNSIKIEKKDNKFGIYVVYSPKSNVIKNDIEDIIDYDITKYDLGLYDDDIMYGMDIDVSKLKSSNILKNGNIYFENTYIMRDGIKIPLMTIYVEFSRKYNMVNLHFGFWIDE